ncbi:MAG TPA: helix-turn-helix domain-containing protein [archaeon]|nr:helix-turn-helix domain-containing protein [archaeon]
MVGNLIKKEFQVLTSEGCFDIAAKKDFLMLIKALTNVDGLNKDQAMSLRAISYFLSAYPFVVSVKTNRETLSNQIIYSRFQLPVVTPNMFESIIEKEEVSLVRSAKGKHSVMIDADALREKRESMQLSLKEFSEIIGISKKALYEIENKRVNPSFDTVNKIESVIETDLKDNYELEKAVPTHLNPKSTFQGKISKEFRRIGIDNSPVCSAPFEIIGKEKFSLITGLSKSEIKIKREASEVSRLSSMFSSRSMFVTKKLKEKSIDGVPIVLESELSEIDSSKELNKLLEEKA